MSHSISRTALAVAALCPLFASAGVSFDRPRTGECCGDAAGTSKFAEPAPAKKGKAKKELAYWAVDRVARSPYAPIKRPPTLRDELLEDADYYTEDFLGQMSREGVNGLWITVRFGEVADDGCTPRDPLADKRLAKLRSIVEKCSRHGIKIWLFTIEPRALAYGDPFLEAHPGAAGPSAYWDSRKAYVSCLSDPAVTNRIYRSVKDVFARVPGLGGLIAITSGERPTTCFSLSDPLSDKPVRCPRCAERSRGELHSMLCKAYADGIRASNPDAKFVSWLYHPQDPSTRGAWIEECSKDLPSSVVAMYNFESGSETVQQGAVRHGGDYWLSRPGPAAPYAAFAAAARANGARLGAKIQVSCSHEIATLPYVPVPGLLYRKYKAMKQEGVSFVMQCWFFGGSPGLMNRAAGILSRSDFSRTEDESLLDLAGSAWGADAPRMAALWKRFSDGYSKYPLSKIGQYYGPFHASCQWDLFPDISMRSLSRTWKPDPRGSGDMIGEAFSDFTLEAALAQAEEMCAPLEAPETVREIESLSEKYADDPELSRELGIMKAMRNIFSGGRDIFAFYLARREGIAASRSRGDNASALACAARMRGIAERAKALTREMIGLCRADARIGWHPEAERLHFDPETLEARLASLDACIARLDAIKGELEAGREWPLSERERSAPVWRAKRLADGSVEFEGVAGGSGGVVEVRTIDLCATEAVRAAASRPGEDGRFRVVLPPAPAGAPDPAWVCIRRGDSLHAAGGAWIWPDKPDFGESRLMHSRVSGDNYGRLEIEPCAMQGRE